MKTLMQASRFLSFFRKIFRKTIADVTNLFLKTKTGKQYEQFDEETDSEKIIRDKKKAICFLKIYSKIVSIIF